MSDPLVSIILRSFNEGWALRETLPALAAQEYKNWELIVFDSGSTDGSVDLLRRAAPKHLSVFPPHEYVPGRVLNQGMKLAASPYGIFLNADATPQGANWLRPLVNALADPKTVAVFGSQIPRPDCRAVFACDYERCFGPQRESTQWDHFFSMVSSGVRKDIWCERPFLETVQYAEDHEFTAYHKARGRRVVYCPESVVMHSHNYTPQQIYKRSFGDNRSLAVTWERSPHHFNVVRTLMLGWLNDARRDWLYCLRHRRLREWPHAVRIRWWQRRGWLDGFRQGWKDYRLS
ncbi:MAG TPA: glycosyltransferase [Verrucomicrobiae bacterium]|jgi:rhamnosyltransferase|nr:glycosyltransferase [Verrucomicrobiae bacterium]